MERIAPTTDIWEEKKNKNHVVDIYSRYIAGNDNFRGFWGSQ
jgi:hypothetical protein